MVDPIEPVESGDVQWGDDFNEIQARFDDPDFVKELADSMRKQMKIEGSDQGAGKTKLMELLQRLNKVVMTPFKLAQSAVNYLKGLTTDEIQDLAEGEDLDMVVRVMMAAAAKQGTRLE